MNSKMPNDFTKMSNDFNDSDPTPKPCSCCPHGHSESVVLDTPVKEALHNFSDNVFKNVINNNSATFVSELIKLGLCDFKTYATNIYPLSDSERNGPFGKWVFSGPRELQQSFASVSQLTFLRPFTLLLLRQAYGEIPSIKAEIDAVCDAPDYVLHSACFSLLGAQCFGRNTSVSSHLLNQMQQISFNMIMFAMIQNQWVEFWPHVKSKF